MQNYNEKNIKAYDKKASNYDNTLDGKFTEEFKRLLVANILVNEYDRVFTKCRQRFLQLNPSVSS